MITMEEVRKWLDPDEVDYESAKQMGKYAIPFLMELVQGKDISLAAKATYLASMINDETAINVVEKAATSNEEVVRVVAGSCIENMSDHAAEKIFDLLHNDEDIGVRKVVLQSIGKLNYDKIESKILKLSQKDSEVFIQDLAKSILQNKK